jgi:hypothetical protein
MNYPVVVIFVNNHSHTTPKSEETSSGKILIAHSSLFFP